jgi:protein-S-isoprenylcysteine O-methyltransferase Ste14
MKGSLVRTSFLASLTIVFTVGLTFATVESPHYVDQLLQNTVATPGGDSHVDGVASLKTELFMAHYHVRIVGYLGFLLLIGLIVLGFTTRLSGLAAVGAAGFMLPVFAQFAGVMFFLAGLGVFNSLWLPLLDISYELQNWGMVINAPKDVMQWLLGLIAIHSMWPTTLGFIGAGILVFGLGVFGWLSARARGAGVVRSGVYRISRHPQYLGWVLWTYGAYLLLQQVHYPRRSWAIGASLPWLISTMVIIGVAMLEELSMRRRYGEVYREYRGDAPFFFPIPRFVEQVFAVPFRLLFNKTVPTRKREIAVVVGLYTVLLVAISALFYAGSLRSTLARFASREARMAGMRALVVQIENEPDWRRQHHMMKQLVAFSDSAVEPLIELLEGEDGGLRVLAAQFLAELPSERAMPSLIAALADPDENMRIRASGALRAIGSREAIPFLMPLLDDPKPNVQIDVMQTLAELGALAVLEIAPRLLASSEFWVRRGAVAALGTLGSPRAVPIMANALRDGSAEVRRDAVIALLRIGCPAARPLLEQALGDDDFEVRLYAAEALKRTD